MLTLKILTRPQTIPDYYTRNDLVTKCVAYPLFFNVQFCIYHKDEWYFSMYVRQTRIFRHAVSVVGKHLQIWKSGSQHHRNSDLHHQYLSKTNSGKQSHGTHCDAMHTLFQNIQEDQIRRKSLQNVVFDQPYIVYNAFKYNVYDNKTITHFITSSNDADDLSRETMIHHFAGGPGSIQKLPRMKTYLHAKNNRTLQSIIANTKSFIQEHLIPILQSCKEPVEGNIFMRHHTNSISDVFMAKCNNICNLSLSNQTKRVLEIGFNAGFSALLMLMSNPNLHLSCFDLGEHSYTQPCFDKLKEKFGDRIQITLGDSTLTLPNVTGTFNLIHIDGGHSTEVATSDIEQCYRLSEPGTILIMDDTNFPNLRLLWDTYIQKYGLRWLQTYVYPTPEHDIRYV